MMPPYDKKAVNDAEEKKIEPGVKKNIKSEKDWRHPQAWVPWDISFFFFIIPFIFWPLVIFYTILYVYNKDTAEVSFESLKNFNPPIISFIYNNDGSVTLAELYQEHRLVVPLEKIPDVVIAAFLAAEDDNFFNHYGVDFMGLVRATLANLKAGHTVQGASTITQQMVRTFLLTNERTYDRKLREIILAWRVEKFLSKEEILYLYLNRIYLGRGAYGVESAAQLYFGKSIDQVTLPEAAMLAGLVKAPSIIGAHLGTERSLARQHYVLGRMRTVGFIDDNTYEIAKKTPLEFIKFRPNHYRETAPQFTEVVRKQLMGIISEEDLLTKGYRIYTTIDLKAQAAAEVALRNGLDALAKRQKMSPRVSRELNSVQVAEYQRSQREKLNNRPLLENQEIGAIITNIVTEGDNIGLEMRVGDEIGFLAYDDIKWILGNKKIDQYFSENDLIMVRAISRNPDNSWNFVSAPPPDLQGGLVLMENATGIVRAIVGGRDFGQSQFNRAVQARRQPGSSFKPFVYTAALDHGYTEASIVYDIPMSYPQSGGKIWSPKNYSGKNSGPISLYDALRLSINVVAVKVCDAVGPEVVAEYAAKMGISSPMTPTLSLALGASEVTLLELTQAYTTYPNLGSWSWPLFIDRIEDSHGNLLRKFEPHLTEAISPQTAYIMTDMLVGVANSGTAARVGSALKVPVAGKTGTTNDQADALFIGFTPEYTCGVWVGRDLRLNLGSGEQGGRSAAPIFIEFMKDFLADKQTGQFKVPKGIVRQKLLTEDSTEDIAQVSGRSYVFKVGEVGVGRIDTAMGMEEAEAEGAADGPMNIGTMSEEELDRRLMEYLQDFERRRGGVR